MLISNSAIETKQIAKKIASELQGGSVVALFGGLGVGKTTFTAGLVEALGIVNSVYSPTFSLVNEYRSNGKVLYHFDMYRINSWEDLDSTGFFDYYYEGNILVCEWSENIENALPENTIKIEIAALDDTKRSISVQGFGKYENISY